MCAIDKAPGPDGFTMGFFRRFWEVVKEDIMKTFQNFYDQEVFERSLNAIFITHPKEERCQGAKRFQAYQLNRQHLQTFC